MPAKPLITIGLIMGSIIGGYIPTFFGAGIFSYSSLLGSGIGAILGIYLAYKLSSF